MTDIQTVPCDVCVQCSLTVHVTPFCPVKDEIDGYDVTVTWQTDDQTFEKWALKERIESYNGSELTQEELTARLGDAVDTEGVVRPSVTVQDTRHMDMTVRVGDTDD